MVISLCATRILKGCSICAIVSGAADVGYSCCHNRARVDVGLSAGISVTESVLSKKVRVVLFTKNVV